MSRLNARNVTFYKFSISGIFPVHLVEVIKCVSLFMTGVTFLVTSLHKQ